MLVKDKAFLHRARYLDKHQAARAKLKSMERIAYARYRKELVKQLSPKQDSSKWWKTVKSHSGTQASRNSVNPDVDSLAKHFGEKLAVSNADDPVSEFSPVEQVVLSTIKFQDHQTKSSESAGRS